MANKARSTKTSTKKPPRKRASVEGPSAKTAKQQGIDEFNERFVHAYLATGENATRAYMAVKPNVKETTAAVEGHRLLRNTKIVSAIARRREELRKKFALTTDRVLQEHARLIYFNPQNLVNDAGEPIPLHELDADTAAALSKVKLTTTEVIGDGPDRRVVQKTTEFQPYSKPNALNLVNKILRMYEAPPPPPPPDPEDQEKIDYLDLARRIAFSLSHGEKLAKKEAAKPNPRRRRITSK